MGLSDNWLVQSVLSNAVWAILVVLGGGVMAYIQNYHPQYLETAKWWLIGSVAVAAMILMLRIPGLLFGSSKKITQANVIVRIKEWSDRFGIAVQRSPQNPDQYVMTMTDGRKADLKIADGYVIMGATLVQDGKEATMLKLLSDDEIETLLERVRIVLGQSGVNSIISKAPLKISVMKQMPVLSDLTEFQFISAVESMNIGFLLARDAMVVNLKDAVRSKRSK